RRRAGEEAALAGDEQGRPAGPRGSAEARRRAGEEAALDQAVVRDRGHQRHGLPRGHVQGDGIPGSEPSPRRRPRANHAMTPLFAARRIVVKIGSSLLTNAGAGLDRGAIADWVRQMATLRARGIEVIVVSSGAIAEGMKRLQWTKRPHAVSELQAAA